jgi:putative methyltransferase (TIGR04325 family)
MNARFAPIAVFAYNRPDHLQRTLEHLALNPEAKDSTFYIFCDGPKADASAEQKKRIAEVTEVAKSRKWGKEVVVQSSVSNKGLAGSVISGVTYVVEKHGSVIVVEDDAMCSPFFLQYMNASLDKYRDDDRVISIAGFIYPVKVKLPDTFFLQGADCIAWATWKRGWDLFEHDGSKLLARLEQSGKQNHFDFGGTYPYTQMLRDQIDAKNDSWAIRWYASAYLANKFTLYPGRPVITNIGFDGSGINSGVSDQWEVTLSATPLKVETIPVEDHAEARKAFAQFFTDMRKTPVSARLKQAIWSRLPSFIRKAWTGSSGTAFSGWQGNFKTWKEALAQSEGYDSQLILDKVAASLHKVKKGEVAYERDSVTFDKPEVQEEVAVWLKKISMENKRALRVIDFGGSLGSTYFQYKSILGEQSIARWTVVEQEHFAAKGVAEFEDDVLKFSSSLGTAGEADVVLLFSVLPYVEYPFDVIRDLVLRKYPYIIIDRTPVISGGKDRLTVQVVPEYIYKASYPAWFFSEQKLLSAFEGYKLEGSFTSKFAAKYKLSDGETAEWKGYVFKRL